MYPYSKYHVNSIYVVEGRSSETDGSEKLFLIFLLGYNAPESGLFSYKFDLSNVSTVDSKCALILVVPASSDNV